MAHRQNVGTANAGDLNAHGTEGHDTSGPTTDDAMTRSEEQLEVGTVSREAGRARLRKYVTTEQETSPFPCRKERAVSSASRSPTPTSATPRRPGHLRGGARGRPPRERAGRRRGGRAGRAGPPGHRDGHEEQTVSEEVRKEHIEAEGDVADRR